MNYFDAKQNGMEWNVIYMFSSLGFLGLHWEFL